MPEPTKIDTAKAMEILGSIYDKTQDNKIREDEILDYMDRLKSNYGGEGEKVANILSGMHKQTGASDRFSTISSLDTLGTPDSLKSEIALPKVFGEERVTAQTKSLHTDIKSKLNDHIEQFNSLKSTATRSSESLQEKRDDLKELKADQQEIVNAKWAEYDWPRFHAATMGWFSGGQTPKMDAMRADPKLSKEISELGQDIYNHRINIHQSKGDLRRSQNYYENQIDKQLYKLNLLEGENKTILKRDDKGLIDNPFEIEEEE